MIFSKVIPPQSSGNAKRSKIGFTTNPFNLRKPDHAVLGIDQHKGQLTINLRNEQGEVVQKDQIMTVHADIDDLFGKLHKKAQKHRGFMAIVEVCGFNDWLLEKLGEAFCDDIIVIQPDNSVVHKIDKNHQCWYEWCRASCGKQRAVVTKRWIGAQAAKGLWADRSK